MASSRTAASLRRLTRAEVPIATEAFARFLIGTLIVRRFADGSIVAGRIVETEAYTSTDPASHSFRGPTARNRAMFGANFHAYVYFIYGTAYCLNISSEERGTGAAVLLRALEPIMGMEIMRANRGPLIADRDLLRGPGRLCAALQINRDLDGADLEIDSRLWLAVDDGVAPDVGVSARIGLTKAVDAGQRFYARGNPFVSGSRRLSPDA